MKNILRKLTTTRILSYSLFAFSLIILAASMYIVSNVRVLENWKLSLPDGMIHSGDQVVLISSYTKLRDVDGVALRYIDCKIKPSNSYVRYPINQAIANRAKGRGGTGVQIVVPRTIPNLPTTCKFSINVTYNVLPFKKDYEKIESKEFTLYPAQQPPAPGAVTPR